MNTLKLKGQQQKMTKYAAINDITGSDEFLALNPELRTKPSKPVDKTEAEKALKKAEREIFANEFETVWKRNNGPELEKEYQFWNEKGWLADYRVGNVLIELEGGVWTGGRHVRPAGFIEDCMKYNKAQMLGYTVYRIPTGCATDKVIGEIIEGIR
jgi:hypothetical protein